jgi:acetyl esterase
MDANPQKLAAGGASVPVDNICWPGMVHGLALVVGAVDAGKALIDKVGVALKTAFA